MEDTESNLAHCVDQYRVFFTHCEVRKRRLPIGLISKMESSLHSSLIASQVVRWMQTLRCIEPQIRDRKRALTQPASNAIEKFSLPIAVRFLFEARYLLPSCVLHTRCISTVCSVHTSARLHNGEWQHENVSLIANASVWRCTGICEKRQPLGSVDAICHADIEKCY